MVGKLKFLLLPLSWILFLVLKMRHFLYDKGYQTSKEYDLPLICVGNLALGGTGKTPMSEYLIALLKPLYPLALLSRGYKRHSKGFILADDNATPTLIGDEPYQLFYKNKDIVVAVSEERTLGVERLLEHFKRKLVVILDDAMQHRKIKAGYYLLLSDYQHLFCDDFLLPVGHLRDLKERAHSAQSIIITKSPSDLTLKKASEIKKRLSLYTPNVYFTQILYSPVVKNLSDEMRLEDFLQKKFTLVTGIANPTPLIKYLKEKKQDFKHLQFPDHHSFSQAEIKALSQEPLILTTEKDFVRLKKELSNLYYLPITTQFIFEEDQKAFEREIFNFCDGFFKD